MRNKHFCFGDSLESVTCVTYLQLHKDSKNTGRDVDVLERQLLDFSTLAKLGGKLN